jgi:hypothetical protein
MKNVAGVTRSLGNEVKRMALFLTGLIGLGAAVVGALLTISASRACTLAPTGTTCYSSSANEFLGVVLLVAGIVLLVIALLRGWADR